MDKSLSMTEGAIGIHEMYTSYVKAGFSEDQAFELIKIMLLQSLGR